MSLRPIVLFVFVLLFTCIGCQRNAASGASDFFIEKDNGRIILAYKAFEDFLQTDKSWGNYKLLLLDAFPEIQEVHTRQLGWGVIDSVQFKEDILKFSIEDYKPFFTQYTHDRLNYLYDSIIEKSHKILAPVSRKQVDLCFFLPYGSCFVVTHEDRNTIYISMLIGPHEVEKIMAHEYSHVLHFERRPDEPLSLKRELVAEGMAVYLTNQIIKELDVSNSVPFMPDSAFVWCTENEQLIKDSIMHELNDTTMQIFLRYIADGSFAKPPEGFVQKTAYFTGYRIIEACVNQGIPLEEICSLDAESIIQRSNYFKFANIVQE